VPAAGLLARLTPCLLLARLSPWLLLVTAALLRGTLIPATALRGLLTLAGLILTPSLSRLTLALTGTRSPRLPLTLTRLAVLSRLAGLRASRLLAPTAATLLRRLPLVRGLLRLLRALAPTATLGRRLLTPAALTPLSPRLSALAPRLPRTPRSLRRRRHIRSF
jgi:hypothetical protein